MHKRIVNTYACRKAIPTSSTKNAIKKITEVKPKNKNIFAKLKNADAIINNNI
jgi:hypothetical protein